MLKRNWFEGTSQIYFFADEGSGEALYQLISQSLHGDYYASLTNIKQNITLNDDFKNSEFVLAIISHGLLYALVGGGASFWVIRGGKTMPLLKTLASTSSIVSGHVQESDVFEVETSTSKESFQQSKQPVFHEEAVSYSHNLSLKHKVAEKIDALLAKLPERKIIVHGDDYPNKRSKKASLIGVALLIILAISIYLGVNRRDENLARSEYEPMLFSAIHNYEEALELAPLSRSRARELILESRSAVKELKDQGVKDERLAKLEQDISSHLGDIAGIYDTPAEVFLDLSIISSGFSATDISWSEGMLRVLDTESRRLAGVEVSNKRTNVISGPDYLPDAIMSASYADRSFILSSDGIREVTDDVELLIKPDGWNPDNVLIYAFAGNMYVLDKDNDQIWRYQGVRGGFLEKEAWLGEGFTRDTSEASFFVIDGAIWTVSNSGQFKVYSLGAPAAFSITNETMPFAEISGFYTDEESEYLYVLDKGNSRIAVLEKSGVYVSEYMSPELANATDLVVDEENGLILFLADSKLYAIKAMHLKEKSDENTE